MFLRQQFISTLFAADVEYLYRFQHLSDSTYIKMHLLKWVWGESSFVEIKKYKDGLWSVRPQRQEVKSRELDVWQFRMALTEKWMIN